MLCVTFVLELVCLFTSVKYTIASFTILEYSNSTLHRHRRQNGCVLPQHPTNGQWSIYKSNARFSPGESIPSGSILQVKCDQTYKLDGDATIVCINEKWTSEVGVCLKCGQKSTRNNPTLIVNGTNAIRGDYPWQVALYNKTSKVLLCGGSLLNQRVILTAAHCITDDTGKLLNKETYTVAVGKYYRKYDHSEDVNKAQFSEIHEMFTTRKYKGHIQNFFGDIAIIVTKKIFFLSDRVQPVCIDWGFKYQRKLLNPNVSKYGYVSGWGYTAEYKNPSEVLKELKVPIITNDQCDTDLPEDYQKFMTDDKICAGFLNARTSVCSGDSGGALVTEYKGRYYAVGIVSLSPQAPTEEGGCDSQQYTLFTSVYYYINELIFEKEARYRPSHSEIASCEEDSKCQPEPVTTTTTTTTTPKPVTEPTTPNCVLPEHPASGQWSIYGVQTKFTPGQFVSPATVLEVTCQKDYKLNGNNLLICHNGKWSPEIGKCSKTCPPVQSTPSTVITCTYKNNETDCSSPPDGTVAKYTCAPFYESTETTKNPVRVCKNGSWDLSKPECVPICGKKYVRAQSLIVNGRKAKGGEHPWQVAIYRNNKFICGGALISENLILTAAHCVRYENREANVDEFTVGVGKNSIRLDDTSDVHAQFSGLQDIIVPKQFNGLYTNLLADIALLVSKKNFTISFSVQPVCLDWANSINLTHNSKGYISGWGYTAEGTKPADDLQELEVSIVSNQDCSQLLTEELKPFLTFDKICAGDPTHNASACNGDAGGPLVVKHNGRFYINGIVSSAEADHTSGRCRSDQYGLFIKVSEYQSFILETMAKYNPRSSTPEITSPKPPPPPPEKPENYCILPNYPDFGRWALFASGSHSPGMSVVAGTILQVTCQNRYKLDGDSIILCDKGQWSSEIGKCLRTCPSILTTNKLQATCVFKGKESENCTEPIEGTQVKYQCAPYYEDKNLAQYPVGNCKDGTWDRATPNCVPICGVKSVQPQQLIIGGNVVKKGDYPWVVAIYHGPQKDFICSGTLISEKIILTAALCVTNSGGKVRDKSDFAVAVGKYYQEFTDSREKISNVQFSDLEAIHVPDYYRGLDQNYYGDIAVLVAKKSFTFTQTVQPVCVDFAANYDNKNLTGFVTGWGFTKENGGVSDELKELKVSLVSVADCRKELPSEFQKYLLTDKICAGYRNKGLSVCKGDSGGGLVVKSSTTGRYNLAGIVTVAPNSPSGGCNSQQYALYTTISHHYEKFLSGKINNR
ncbi:hypothetical protein TcasGA2_TC031984 [Tribolium castaneum]|uniref:Uncharacterized protein n=1 Tax=Tribolium castaneum TaxID=7070 RepID=A0A139WNQ4_TRICA|nr:hypothetical protein TcasGA2_TC031984 [Tribolium castaneum]